MVVSRAPVVGSVLLLVACAPNLTPQQEWVMTTFEACKTETGGWNAYLERVEPNGRYHVRVAQTQSDFNRVAACMDAKRAAELARLADAETRPGRIASGAAVASVELQTVDDAMVVSASVNAAAGLRLVVDTGATLTILRPAAARRAGVSSDPPLRTEIQTVVGGRTVTVPIARARSLQVGEAVIEDMEIGVFDALPSTTDVDGLLGNDFLRRFRVSIDRAQKHLMFEAVSR